MTEFIFDWPEKRDEKVWLTIGSFDGLHLGHQSLIERVKQMAAKDGARSLVVTFEPHPRVFLQQISGRYYLTDPQEKKDLLTRIGLDLVLVLPFNQGLSLLSAEEFIARLAGSFDLRGLVVGPDFVLGHNRSGTLPVIAEICRAKEIGMITAEPFCLDGEPVSSRKVRAALQEGRMRDASRLLGRPYRVIGMVAVGKKRGTKLGFPTANQIPHEQKLLPKYGVYATWAYINGSRYQAVTSVGVRPTFEETDIPNIETLLLDFDDNIYGRELIVDFIAYLREEIKYSNAADLIQQIDADKADAKRILEHEPNP